MKLEHNVEYTLKDNKGYVMAIDQSTSFKTIMNFVDDYNLDNDNVGSMYTLLQTKGVAYLMRLDWELTIFRVDNGWATKFKRSGYVRGSRHT